MGKVIDAVMRNRAKLGGLFLALWGVAQADPFLTEKHPRWNAYLGAAVAYVMASGLHKSDQYHRDQQAK